MASKLDAFRKKQSPLSDRMASVQDNLMIDTPVVTIPEQPEKEPNDAVKKITDAVVGVSTEDKLLAITKPNKPKTTKPNKEKRATDNVVENEANITLKTADIKATDIPAKEQTEKVELKPKALMLTHVLTRSLRMKAKRAHLTIGAYVGQLIEKEIGEVKLDYVGEKYLIGLYEACKGKYTEEKERNTAYIEKELTAKAETICDMAGISFTNFINYLLDKDNN